MSPGGTEVAPTAGNWDKFACTEAAEQDHLEVLQWLRLPDKPEGQFPWYGDT